MKCARLRLQERPKIRPDFQPAMGKEIKPRRYCQKRMVDPAHEEDPRWTNIFQRYHCKKSLDQGDNTDAGSTPIDDQDDICLTVQNLKFQGEVHNTIRPRTSFKYRLLEDKKRHRMFVKQVVEDIEAEEDSSSLSSYYFDDYVKYILSNDRSRPSSSKSSIFLETIVNNGIESKAVQVENKPKNETDKNKKNVKKYTPETNTEDITDKNNDNTNENNIDDANVSFHKSGKRRSLTISRVPSPETFQVIRVDVVCNYSTSSILSDYDDKSENTTKYDKMEDIKLKGPHFSNKYLVTNTAKTLDANVSGGAKVTLLCKTFKLSDRLKLSDRKKTKMVKDVLKLRK